MKQILFIVLFLCTALPALFAQTDSVEVFPKDSAEASPTVSAEASPTDSAEASPTDSAEASFPTDMEALEQYINDDDSLFAATKKLKAPKPPKDWSKWSPDPKRAMWLGIVLPGAGQIYNRKYWKLPIVYGGFMGCIYAWRWNNMMYRDYSQAYIDLMDDDPNTQSYNSFMHLGAQINDGNKQRYENLFKRRKDFYRRYRDLSIFCLIGVYALSIIDAYVDASLSQFDISDDLSMRIEPTLMNSRGNGWSSGRGNGWDSGRNNGWSNGGFRFDNAAIGVNCQLTF